jgi:hypothetical protein
MNISQQINNQLNPRQWETGNCNDSKKLSFFQMTLFMSTGNEGYFAACNPEPALLALYSYKPKSKDI